MEPCGTPASICLVVDISPCTETLNFGSENVIISLIKLSENSNLGSLYSKPVGHAVSTAFSISKNTAAVDILLSKLRVTWSASPYVEESCCDAHESQTELHLATF
jgi:hypothetical protein